MTFAKAISNDERVSARYRHTQIGTLMIASLGGSFLLIFALQLITEWTIVATVVMAILGICLLLFSTLTVAIEDGFLKCWFGPGLIRKKMRLSDIEKCRTVRNSWLAGWGIRWLPDGSTLWNVSGLDAVEVTLESKTRFRIGTDEPEKLLRALENAIRELR